MYLLPVIEYSGVKMATVHAPHYTDVEKARAIPPYHSKQVLPMLCWSWALQVGYAGIYVKVIK